MGVECCNIVLYRHANIGTSDLGWGELTCEPFLQDSRQESPAAIEFDLHTTRPERGLHQNSSG
jgi:hypothetical protein